MEQLKQHMAALHIRTTTGTLAQQMRAFALSIMLIATLLFGIDPSEGSRKGRYTATDIQVFNPTHSRLQAAVLWTNEDDSFQALLPVDIDPRASNYYTPELSGLIPSTFIGGIEIISDSYQLYATVTHFDKGNGAPAFERGNEHYEARAADNNGLQLQAPTLMRNKLVGSNISILNSISTRPVTVTLQLHQDSGIVAASYVTTAVGNLLIDLNDVLSPTVDFSGTARIFASQPIAAYVSIYDGIGQKGYSAAPVVTPTLMQKPSTLTRNVLPLLQPTDDEQITRTLYLQNVEYYEANVIVRTRFAPLFTTTIPRSGKWLTHSLTAKPSPKCLLTPISASKGSCLLMMQTKTTAITSPAQRLTLRSSPTAIWRCCKQQAQRQRRIVPSPPRCMADTTVGKQN